MVVAVWRRDEEEKLLSASQRLSALVPCTTAYLDTDALFNKLGALLRTIKVIPIVSSQNKEEVQSFLSVVSRELCNTSRRNAAAIAVWVMIHGWGKSGFLSSSR